MQDVSQEIFNPALSWTVHIHLQVKKKKKKMLLYFWLFLFFDVIYCYKYCSYIHKFDLLPLILVENPSMDWCQNTKAKNLICPLRQC